MVQFQLAGLEDAETLAVIRQRAWDSAYRGIYADEMIDRFDYAGHAARFRAQINNPALTLYCIHDNGCVVGFFSLYILEVAEYKQFPVCLNSLYLLPEYQRMGIGRQVMTFTNTWCRARGYRMFYNSCSLHNRKARAFYEAMGGVLGEIDGGYDDPGADQCYYEYTVE